MGLPAELDDLRSPGRSFSPSTSPPLVVFAARQSGTYSSFSRYISLYCLSGSKRQRPDAPHVARRHDGTSFALPYQPCHLLSTAFSPARVAMTPPSFPARFICLRAFAQGGERAASTAVSACLSVLVRLEQECSAYVVANPACLPWVALNGVASADGCGGWGGDGCTEGPYPGVSPEVKFYHLANACMYGAAVLSATGAEKDFDWLLSRWGDRNRSQA